jgi:hypothetical protein
MVNEELTSPIVPSRGIWQGQGPISPSIFLLCIEGLSNLLFRKEPMGVLQGVRNVRADPPITHLAFKDDIILFALSESRSVDALKETPIVHV